MNADEQIAGVVGQIARIRELANEYIEQGLRQVKMEGILPAHGAVLFFLFQQNKPVAMKLIVEKVGRVKSTVTGMVHTLEQHGYVEKTQSPEDGRVMLVQLTEKGRAVRPHFESISQSLQEKLYGAMPDAARLTLVKGLAQVRANLDR